MVRETTPQLLYKLAVKGSSRHITSVLCYMIVTC